MEDNPTVTGEFTGRYTIERELGRGGAAVVYLARDNRQERHVALKVLHKELAQAIGAQRFLREIKHSSALQHPHLLTILDSGESRGTLYYVMPYMADGSLRTRIANEKQLPIDDALRITKDVGEALAYAHAKGIVHRDIKPDNVLFSGDHACLADFGIARAVDSVAADTLTSTGLVVGTPAYMSPEQASGEKTVDARSDQYSLGCLLYEMITGLPPFIGATQQSVISQRFTQPPPSMRVHRPNVPDQVERAVKRALAVIPADRFPTVKEFVEALHEPSAAPEPVSVHRIRRRWFAVGAAAAILILAVIAAKPGAAWVRGAFGPQLDTANFVVLPFLSEDDPGMGKRVADGLYSALREWQGLGLEGDVEVLGVVADAGGQVTLLSDALGIARKLGAGRLVWGTVRREGGQARIVATLYDVDRSARLVERSDAVPWGAFGDSAFRDLGNGLLAVVSIPDAFDPGYAGTRSFPALQAYRRGMAALGDFKLEFAREELRRTVLLDPEFAVAQFELARLESWLEQRDATAWHASAMRAVALKHELRPRDAIRAAALFAYAQEDYPTACRHYEALIASDTLDASAWYGLGQCMHDDDAVLADWRSRSRFRFRSSWHTAGQAFLRALEIEPRLYATPLFGRLRQVFPTAHNQTRSGDPAGKYPAGFGARPSLHAETLAYTPYPMPDFERESDAASRQLRFAALEKNRRILLDVTNTWVSTYRLSSEAHGARAMVLEVQGDFDGAVRSLALARLFARNPLEKLDLADAEVRVRLKDGDFAGARSVADSALVAARETTAENWLAIARMAGLAGKRDQLADALQYFWPRYGLVEDLHQSVARAAGAALANSALGICDRPPPEVERELANLIRIHVRPDRRGMVTERVGGMVLSHSIPCAVGNNVGSIGGLQRILRAQRAFATGQGSLARAILDSVATGRVDLRAAEVSPSLITREASLLLALGDTALARERLDGTLGGLNGISASLLLYPLESAVLVRMMVTRADLAAKSNDPVNARKWSRAVAVLWADAHPTLTSTVARMKALAGTGSPK